MANIGKSNLMVLGVIVNHDKVLIMTVEVMNVEVLDVFNTTTAMMVSVNSKFMYHLLMEKFCPVIIWSGKCRLIKYLVVTSIQRRRRCGLLLLNSPIIL